MERTEKKNVVYTAQSKYYYFARMMITKFVLEKNYIPLNPFNNWAYFMDDMVDRELVIRANNNLVIMCDEVWCFGPIADGVLAEVRFAASMGKKIKFYSAGKKYEDINEISVEELIFEEEVLRENRKEDLLEELTVYAKNTMSH